jgi:hypothetical protein
MVRRNFLAATAALEQGREEVCAVTQVLERDAGLVALLGRQIDETFATLARPLVQTVESALRERGRRKPLAVVGRSRSPATRDAERIGVEHEARGRRRLDQRAGVPRRPFRAAPPKRPAARQSSRRGPARRRGLPRRGSEAHPDRAPARELDAIRFASARSRWNPSCGIAR